MKPKHSPPDDLRPEYDFDYRNGTRRTARSLAASDRRGPTPCGGMRGELALVRWNKASQRVSPQRKTRNAGSCIIPETAVKNPG